MVRLSYSPEIKISDEIENIILKAAEKTLLLEESNYCEVSIYITNDEEIQELNRIYRNVDAPTDVLAFAMREGEDGELNREILGDVIISLSTAERQANEFGHSLEIEIALLVAHGILHLLGYDHIDDSQAIIMKQKEKLVLDSLFGA
ncbi:MAG: rRNA maturation RNase YbeY [bacterium]